MTAEQLIIRRATNDDLPDIARIVSYPPEPPMASLLGARRAGRLSELLIAAGVRLSLTHAHVAVLGGRVAGVMECGMRPGSTLTTVKLLRLLPRIVSILGPALPRAMYGAYLQQRLQFAVRAEAFPVGELYVEERMRNRGIGGRLLEHADSLAEEAGAASMSVETGIQNPARRLYERHGYKAVEEKTSAAYQRLTGSPGRVLMIKSELRR